MAPLSYPKGFSSQGLGAAEGQEAAQGGGVELLLVPDEGELAGEAATRGEGNQAPLCQPIRHGADPRLALEMALVRIARLGEVQDLERLVQRIERAEAGAGPR